MSGLPEEELDLDTGKTRILSPPDPKMSDDTRPRMDGRTWLRQGVSPYLPPPVVRAMAQLDPKLEPYVGPEASITLLTSLLVCLLLVPLLQALTGSGTGLSSGKAIADDDHEDEPLTQQHQDDFGDTVMLCGPMGAGKTRIFYHLCQGPSQASMPTVMSLRANAALLTTTTTSDKALRVLDYPGHSGLQDELFQQLWESSSQPLSNKQLRIVLVVDATQSMATAADFLYDLLQYATTTTPNTVYHIFVACHKCDLSSSKNPRRIKLLLRSELEKLIQVRITQATSTTEDNNNTSTSNTTWWKEGGTLDLDQLKNAKLRFEATTCSVGDGIDALAEFCKHGTME